MKKGVLLLAFLYSGLVFAENNIIAQYKMSPGFTPNPVQVTVSLFSDGTVVKEFQAPQNTIKYTKEVIAKISGTALLNIQREINRIPYNSKLIDLEPKKPRCTDAPTSQVAILNNGQSLVSYLRSGCHTSTLQYGIADSFNTVMLGFAVLAN